MYVPGKLSDSDKVLVDIGTGYYVEKVHGQFFELVLVSRFLLFTLLTAQCRDEAKEFFQRKIDFVTKNLEKMQQVLMEKHKMKESEFSSIV